MQFSFSRFSTVAVQKSIRSLWSSKKDQGIHWLINTTAVHLQPVYIHTKAEVQIVVVLRKRKQANAFLMNYAINVETPSCVTYTAFMGSYISTNAVKWMKSIQRFYSSHGIGIARTFLTQFPL